MKRLSIFIVLLLMATSASAGTTGEITLGGQFVGDNDTDKSAKFLEYRDLDDQLLSRFSFSNFQDSVFLTGEAKNIGYDDQEFSLDGTCFGNGKFSLWYDELTHNYSLDDKILHYGTGTGDLVYSGADLTDATTWLSHDYQIERNQVGASFEITLDSPFFFAADITRTETEGTYPIAVQNGGRTPLELPAPIDYTTNNFIFKAGYSTEKIFVQADVTFSEFENGSDLLNWEKTNGDPGDIYTLAPDNESMQIGGQLVVRDLPLKSVLALRASHAKNESDPVLPGLLTNKAGISNWDGEINYTNFDVKLKSKPSALLSTAIAYHYTKKDNDATSFDYPDNNGNDGEGDLPGEAITHVFSYTKYGIDLEAAYKLNKANRLKAGYGFENVERPEMRHDAEETDTHTLFAEWKNSSLDWAVSKLRYEHMMRESDFEGAQFADMFGPNASEEIARYSRPFDAADKDQDTLKWQLDLMPSETVDLGIELGYSVGDYDKTVIGRTEDTERSILVDTSISMPMEAKLYAYVEYVEREFDSSYVRYRNNAAGNIDGGVPIAAADEVFTDGANDRYNWNLEREDIATSFGVKCVVPVLDNRLKLSAAYDYTDNDGEADFSAAARDFDDISAYGDYEFQTFKLTGEYSLNDNMVLTVGYIYEDYDMDDIATNDYMYIFDSVEYFSGAYADMDYDTSIGYVTLTYKF